MEDDLAASLLVVLALYAADYQKIRGKILNNVATFLIWERRIVTKAQWDASIMAISDFIAGGEQHHEARL